MCFLIEIKFGGRTKQLLSGPKIEFLSIRLAYMFHVFLQSVLKSLALYFHTIVGLKVIEPQTIYICFQTTKSFAELIIIIIIYKFARSRWVRLLLGMINMSATVKLLQEKCSTVRKQELLTTAIKKVSCTVLLWLYRLLNVSCLMLNVKYFTQNSKQNLQSTGILSWVN